jgi:DNA-binding beta-propeller fold protein YncE
LRKNSLAVICTLVAFLVFGIPTLELSAVAANPIHVVSSIATGYNPFSMAYDSKDKVIFVANTGNGSSGTGSLTAVDATSYAVLSTIKIVGSPRDLVYNPSNDEVYVRSFKASMLTVISGATHAVLTRISSEDCFYALCYGGMAYDPANGNVYVADLQYHTVTVITTTNTETRIHVGNSPEKVAYNPATKNIYVVVGTCDKQCTALPPYVAVINSLTNTVVGNISLTGSSPDPCRACSIVYDPANSEMYVANDFGQVFAVSNQELVGAIHVSSCSSTCNNGIAYNPGNKEMYVSSDSDVAAISSSTNKVLKTIATPESNCGVSDFGFPCLALAYDSINQDIYIAGNTAYVISGASNTIVSQVKIGSGGSVIFDSVKGTMFETVRSVPGYVDVMSSG